MRRIWFCLLIFFLLSACNIPLPDGGQAFSISKEQPGNEPGNIQTICSYNWATQALPELDVEIQLRMEAADLTSVVVTSEAYGEECFDSQTSQPVSFAAMETDFHVQVSVPDLTDRVNLGNLLEQILFVLDEFPPGSTPGTQPGYIGVSFQKNDEQLNLWFLYSDGINARSQDLHGDALLEYLMDH
jgi:hypothetical protein